MNKYFVFSQTKKRLKEKYPKSILDKYYEPLAFIYQNGYDLNCSEEEVEEQLGLFNFFQTKEDLDEAIVAGGKCYHNGRSLVEDEFLDIIKDTAFSREEISSPTLAKLKATNNWDRIIGVVDRIENVLKCDDLEVAFTLQMLPSKREIEKKISDIKSSIGRELKVLTWVNFSALTKVVYSSYIQLSKNNGREVKLPAVANVNEELYGGIGGYNFLTKEIKCIIGSAVYDLKMCKNSKTMTKVRQVTKEILKGEEPSEGDDDEIKYLIRWDKGLERDDARARKAVINSSLFGILDLLSLKHCLNFREDPANSLKAEKVQEEFRAIMNYCNITKEDLN